MCRPRPSYATPRIGDAHAGGREFSEWIPMLVPPIPAQPLLTICAGKWCKYS